MGKRTMNKQMAESIILAKLYKDGFILVDEKNKKAVVDMRRGKLVKRYKESSYDDIVSILERTAKGLKMAGYEITVKQGAIEHLEAVLSKNKAGDGFVSQN